MTSCFVLRDQRKTIGPGYMSVDDEAFTLGGCSEFIYFSRRNCIYKNTYEQLKLIWQDLLSRINMQWSPFLLTLNPRVALLKNCFYPGATHDYIIAIYFDRHLWHKKCVSISLQLESKAILESMNIIHRLCECIQSDFLDIQTCSP